jgi:hypothetical protein
MNPVEDNKTCADVAPLLVFYVCDEVSEQERATIESHLALCPDCQAQSKDEQEFQGLLTSMPPSSGEVDSAGILLSQCRSELAETLDDIDRPPVKQRIAPFTFLRHWMALHPAWSAATLVLFGLVAGSESTQWMTGQRNTMAVDQAVSIHPRPQLTQDQLSKMVDAGVNFTPASDDGSRNVRVLLNAEQPVELTGNMDDPDVRNVMTFVVKNGERFDPGVRLDCLDALRTRAEDSEVRSALLCAARKDHNPAVRLKALEALRASTSDGEVREALLDALKHDSNPGVRVEAVNLLVRSLEDSEQNPAPMSVPLPQLGTSGMLQASSAMSPNGSLENVIRALGDLQQNDSSRYVRMRSAAALREINARNER